MGGIQASLLLADRRLEQAAVEAEVAAEAYHGAMWLLSLAKEDVDRAQVEAAARQTVRKQRDVIGRLVATSYQLGVELPALSAMIRKEAAEARAQAAARRKAERAEQVARAARARRAGAADRREKMDAPAPAPAPAQPTPRRRHRPLPLPPAAVAAPNGRSRTPRRRSASPTCGEQPGRTRGTARA